MYKTFFTITVWNFELGLLNEADYQLMNRPFLRLCGCFLIEKIEWLYFCGHQS